MKKHNLVEILKNCPKGMELDCTMFDNVSFLRIQNGTNQIIICTPDGLRFLNAYGCYHDDYSAKCVIFPKGKTTWEGFHRPFVDGDIVADEQGNIAIYKQIHKFFNEPYVDFYCGLAHCNKLFIIKNDEYQNWGKIKYIEFATEEEKERLFQAIKDNGYKWNAETKTLEKLVKPKFKVGDRVLRDDYVVEITEIDIEEEVYIYESKVGGIGCILFSEQDYWELIPNKFDINTFKPFESRVLVRDKNTDEWRGHFFSHCANNSDRPYVCIGTEGINEYKQCIPYEGNEHLLGKTDDCSIFYKTWSND